MTPKQTELQGSLERGRHLSKSFSCRSSSALCIWQKQRREHGMQLSTHLAECCASNSAMGSQTHSLLVLGKNGFVWMSTFTVSYPLLKGKPKEPIFEKTAPIIKPILTFSNGRAKEKSYESPLCEARCFGSRAPLETWSGMNETLWDKSTNLHPRPWEKAGPSWVRI